MRIYRECEGRIYIVKNILVIPSLKPDEKLIKLVNDINGSELLNMIESILIVDDGSGDAYSDCFKRCGELGCVILRHEVNRGKGAALKTAASYIRDAFGKDYGMITADSDGQHLPKDIIKVAKDMEENPDSLVLGVRKFGKGTPAKSLFGNRLTSLIFKLICGIWVPDTQTGLRGIPPSLMAVSANEEGDRYEYEMNILMDACLTNKFYYTPIETVYHDDNKGSHFRPLRDGVRVYGRFIRFLLASVGGFVVDILLFSLLTAALPAFSLEGGGVFPVFMTGNVPGDIDSARIMLATIIARICSGAVNFLLNKHIAFKSDEKTSAEAVRYFVLFVCQMLVSGICTAIITKVLKIAAFAKIIVDVVLFFISFRIQRAWVFRKRTEK